MTDDLVKRLRDKADRKSPNLYKEMERIETEAADRIEALEELLKWVLGTIGHDHPAKKAIRAALGEKKDG